MYDAYHHISIIEDSRPRKGLPARDADGADNAQDLIVQPGLYDVVGGLCENNDKFAKDRDLGVEPKVGDVAVIHDTGVHGHSMGFNYNGKPRSAEYLYRPDGTVLQIRRAETLEDIFSTMDLESALDFGSSSAARCNLSLATRESSTTCKGDTFSFADGCTIEQM